ncbi:MAG: protein tyrosine phosphatase, partial [Deltaproteobacteria bacterium]|nr:protein tyrosine phosphatase [Deltaproteobacteria bacterium]
MAEGYADLHCHLLPGVDDGAKGPDEALEMARALVDLGYSAAAPSPHARGEYAPRPAQEAALEALRESLAAHALPLQLHANAEHFFFEEGFLEQVASGTVRKVGGGRCVLVEAPYTAPLPTLTDLVFRMNLKGCTPLIAHPERCMEFERPG